MKKNLLCFIVVLVVLASCKKKDKIPSDVIPQKKMQGVLWDMMRADQFLSDYVLNRDTTIDKIKERLKYYQQIFSIHKISKEEFDRSFAFYNTRPALFKAIMDSISVPPGSGENAPTEQVTTPVIVYDSTVQQSPRPVQADTPLKLRKRPVVAE